MMATDPKASLRKARQQGSPAQRKPGEATPAADGKAAIERKVRVTVDLPESLHRRLKVRVAEEGVDAMSFVRGLLEQALK